MTRKGFALFAVAVVLAGAAITGATWASARSTSDGTANATTVGYGAGMMGRADVTGDAGMMGGTGMMGRTGTMGGTGLGAAMMGGGYGVAGDGRRVASLAGARQRAQVLA